MPRTENSKRRGIRFCGDCGYELARDNDGTRPMCRRFEQLRLDFTVPRPSDLAAQRAGSRDTDSSEVAEGWPPTVAEYRAILAERRLRSGSSGQDSLAVIRTPALKQSQLPSPPQGATVQEDGVVPPSLPAPPANDLASASPLTAKAKRAAKAENRRSARARVRSLARPEITNPPATGTSTAPVELGGVAATPCPSTSPKAVWALGVTAAGTRDEALTPEQETRPLTEAGSVRDRVLRSGAMVPLPSLTTVTIVVASGLMGVAVAVLMSSP